MGLLTLCETWQNAAFHHPTTVLLAIRGREGEKNDAFDGPYPAVYPVSNSQGTASEMACFCRNSISKPQASILCCTLEVSHTRWRYSSPC